MRKIEVSHIKYDPRRKRCALEIRAAILDLFMKRNLFILLVFLAFLFALMRPLGFGPYGFFEVLLISGTVIVFMFGAICSVGLIATVRLVSSRFNLVVSLASVLLVISSVASALLMLVLFGAATREYYGETRLFLQTVVVIWSIAFSISYGVAHILEPKIKAAFEQLNIRVSLGFEASSRIEAIQKLLPYPVRGTVCRIDAEDKHILVRTENGQFLLTMSLGRAIEMLDPDQGLRIHRSHWVNWSEIDKITFQNGNPRVLTKRAEIVPVSRKQLAQIKTVLKTRGDKS